MAVKSIVDVEINDADFKRFAGLFAKYKESLDKTPAAWKKVGDEVEGVIDRIGEGLDDASEASEGVEKSAGRSMVAFRQTYINITNQATALQQVAAENVKVTRETQKQQRSWHEMARDATRFSSRVVDATRSLLRWGELTGLISGILGAGGLFGIDRLASSAGAQRRTALGYGATAGEAAAFKTNYGRLLDPEAFLSNVNRGITDVTSPQFLAMRVAGAHPENQTDAASAAVETVMALKRRVDMLPAGPLFGATAHAQQLDQLMSLEELRRLRNTPQSEVESYAKHYAADERTMGIPPAALRAWQNLQVQLDRAGTSIENAFIRGLTPLAPQIEKLSNAFTQLVESVLGSKTIRTWIDDLADGIKWLADYMGTPKFRTDVVGFIDKVGDLASKVGDFVKNVADIVEALAGAASSIRNLFHFDKDSTTGTNGPITDDNPNMPGSPEWKARQAEIARSHGVAPDDFSFLRPWTWGHQQSNGELPRGIRNNNWLNLSYVPGQPGVRGSDGRFGVYDTPEAGIAASENQLLQYRSSGADTLSKIITRWAPPSENDTAGYIADIARQTGRDPNAPFDVRNREDAAALIAAMARHETGRRIDPDVVNRGVGQVLGQPALNQSNGAAGTHVYIHNNTGGNAYVSASQLVF